jgi:hypothetical protein
MNFIFSRHGEFPPGTMDVPFSTRRHYIARRAAMSTAGKAAPEEHVGIKNPITS